MNVKLDLKPPFAIFQLKGDLAFPDLAEIRKVINPILRQRKYKIIFDLNNLESIDSSGVALFFHIAQETSSYKDGSFSLTAPGNFVKDVMVISGIYNKFTIFESTEDAMK